MKNVLLPTDFSKNSLNAIAYTLKFFENSACNFYLLHTIKMGNVAMDESLHVMTTNDIEALYINPARKKLRDTIEHISTKFPNNEKNKFYALTDFTFLVDAIRKQVSEKKIDIIVMGTKGATGFKKIIVGSNSGDVITKVHCTTLVVPENAKFSGLKEIAFPTDYSMLYDINVLQPILEITEHTDAALRVLHIHKKNGGLTTDQLKSQELLEDYFSDQQHSFHVLINKNIEDAIQCFVESRHIDMIAMVAKNLNYFQQILFHSKIEHISYHTDVPFLVLH